MDMDLNLLANRIKEIRNVLGISQKDFAEKIDISPGYLSEVEKGKYNPGFSFFFNIAKNFQVNLHYLFFGEGEIFVKKAGTVKEPSDFYESLMGEDSRAIREMLWYFEHSPLVRHSILGIFTRFIYENEIFINKDIEKNKNKKEE